MGYDKWALLFLALVIAAILIRHTWRLMTARPRGLRSRMMSNTDMLQLEESDRLDEDRDKNPEKYFENDVMLAIHAKENLSTPVEHIKLVFGEKVATEVARRSKPCV